MKKSILVLAVLMANTAFAAEKLAKSVTCEVNAVVAEKTIPKKGKSISDLLHNSTTENLVTFEVGCELLNKPDGRCAGGMRSKQLQVAYRYNAVAEKGAIEIYDDVTGLSLETAWIKEDGIQPNFENKSIIGGMRAVSSLRSKKGGLLGRNQVFLIETVCSPNY